MREIVRSDVNEEWAHSGVVDCLLDRPENLYKQTSHILVDKMGFIFNLTP